MSEQNQELQALQEKLEKLDIEASTLLQNKEVDAGFAKTSEAVKLIEQHKPSLPKEIIANVYNTHGIAYLAKRETAASIGNFQAALNIFPAHGPARINLGNIYANAGDHDQAITAYSKVVEYAKQAPKEEIQYSLVNALQNLAHTHRQLGEQESKKANHVAAKDHFAKSLKNFIELVNILDPSKTPNPDLADAYFWQDSVRRRIKNYDAPPSAPITHNDMSDMLDTWDQTNKYDVNIKSGNIFCYLAHETLDISDKKQRINIFISLLSLLKLTQHAEQKKLAEKPANQKLIAHYTNLHVVKFLVRNRPFRMYNAAYMNDPEEGKALSKTLQDSSEIENNTKLSPLSEAFIGSFVNPPARGEEARELLLWRSYGKHEGEEAAGACLIFANNNLSDFSPLFSNITRKQSEQLTQSQISAVHYKGKFEEEILITLKKNLQNINDFIQANPQHEKIMETLKQDILGGIKFLFKNAYHSEEQEIRILSRCLESNSEKLAQRLTIIKDVRVDIGRHPPRFYVEAPKGLELKEIIFGPLVKNYEEWAAWIKKYRLENNLPEIKVRKSKLRYGSQRG